MNVRSPLSLYFSYYCLLLENANKLEETARGVHISCTDAYDGYCKHGKCESSTNMLEPYCRYEFLYSDFLINEPMKQ